MLLEFRDLARCYPLLGGVLDSVTPLLKEPALSQRLGDGEYILPLGELMFPQDNVF